MTRSSQVGLLQDQILTLAENKQSGAIRGGSTRAGPSQNAILSTKGLNQIRFFDPDDLVLGVEAGLPFSKLEAVLSQHGLVLPVNSWFKGATVGGVLAANEFGPDRTFGGGIRDFTIGIEYLNGRGEVVKAGGRVVKNVAGYDLSRMMIGSLGGLGLVTAVHFKVLPARVKPHTLCLEMRGAQWLQRFYDGIYRAHLPIDWAQAVLCGGSWLLALGVSGAESRRHRLVQALQKTFENKLTLCMEGDEPEEFRFVRHRLSGFLDPHFDRIDQTLMHLHGIYPLGIFAEHPELLDALAAFKSTLVFHPLSGDFHLFLKAFEANIPAVEQLHKSLSLHGGFLIPEGGPAEVKRRILPFSRPGEFFLMKRLKAVLDPLNLFDSPFYGVGS